MKQWFLIAYLYLAIINFARATDKIVIVDINSLFKQLAQKTGVAVKLANEFKGRISELQHIEDDLQSKIQTLQKDGYTMKTNERNKLEKDVMFQRQTFSKKIQAFEHDHRNRSNDERSKLINRIQTAIGKIATDEGIDLVIDTNFILFNSRKIKNITTDVLNRLNINAFD